MKRDKAQAIYNRAVQVFPGGVNSNFRYWGPDTPVVSKAEGPYIWDADGKQYVDFRLGWGPIILGHSYPAVVERVAEAIRHGTVFAATTELEVQVAERIVRLVPGLEMLRFANSGSEATMHALRLARAHTNREKFIKFEGQYHGMHDYALFTTASANLGVIGSRRNPIPQPMSSGIPKGIREYVFTLPFNDFEMVEKTVKEHWWELAAIMVEPVLGNVGGIEPEPGFLEHLRKLCDEHGIVLIMDEVKTGFRVANGGAQEVYGVRADIATYAKGLGNGFPVAAFGGKKEVMSTLVPGQVSHGGTFTANTVGMVAADTVLELLETQPILKTVAQRGQRLKSGLDEILSDAGVPHFMTGLPAMQGFMVSEKPVKELRDLKHHDAAFYDALLLNLMELGVWAEPDAREPWFLCYDHSDALIDETLNKFEDALKKTMSETGGPKGQTQVEGE
ncbi:MAG: glutamate-1-semialdehyde 2,1-aminomutase [Anaerolineae bacterium]